MNFFFGILRVCEVINFLIFFITWTFVKLLLLTPVIVIGYVIYKVLF